MSEIFGKKEEKRQILKELLKKLHAGASPDEIKENFRTILDEIGADDVAKIEEELIHEGIPREEIQKLCDIHLAIFKESLEKEKPLVEQGHPIHILMEEHKSLLQLANEMRTIVLKCMDFNTLNEVAHEIERLTHITEYFKDSEKHYLREENVLFPYLEKHGITQPPAVMWAEHKEIRKLKKEVYNIIENAPNINYHDFIRNIDNTSWALTNVLQNHFYKENNILFPTAMRVISKNEWADIKSQFNEIGYCCFTTDETRGKAENSEYDKKELVYGKRISLKTGSFSVDELEAILNTLPVDITFVDKGDTVRYFNQAKDRIFTRTTAVIGRKVQNCHPPQSLNKVEQILNDFKSGKRDAAEFWINLKGRLVHIRYFAVRKEGEYLGTIEVTQDITDIKKIEGEKRLLD